MNYYCWSTSFCLITVIVWRVLVSLRPSFTPRPLWPIELETNHREDWCFIRRSKPEPSPGVAFNQEKALVGAYSVIVNLREGSLPAPVTSRALVPMFMSLLDKLSDKRWIWKILMVICQDMKLCGYEKWSLVADSILYFPLQPGTARGAGALTVPTQRKVLAIGRQWGMKLHISISLNTMN